MLRLQLISLLIILSCTRVNAQAKDSLNRTDKKGYKQGHWIKKDEKGNTIYDGSFLNDKPVRKFHYYYPNGKIKSITTFYKQDYVAFTELFTAEGKRMTKGKVIGEQKDSTWLFYNSNDSLESVENYALGKKNGDVLNYFRNGKLIESLIYKNDVLDGICKRYYESGVMREESVYKNGLYEGKVKFYYPSGQLSTEGLYAHDFKEGTWNYYSENGSLEWQVSYKKSNEIKVIRYNGIEEQFYPSKLPKSKTTFKNGTKNGPFTEYYDAGDVKQEIAPAKDGYPEETKEVITNQKIKLRGNFINDKLDGKVTYYKLDGTIEKQETYKLGELMK